MATKTPGTGQATSTPDSLPSAPPPNFGSPDHSFTLQMVMELQKSTGSIETQLKALSLQLDKIEERQVKADDKVDTKIDNLTESLISVKTRLTVLAQVSTILFALAMLAGGVLWTVTQDAFKDITKSAINSALLSGKSQEPPK